MTNFKDIKWQQHRIGAGVHGQLKLKNGWQISLVAGEFFYSTPKANRRNHNQYSTFEVAIINPNGNIDGDVIGWQSREDIDKLIKKLS